MSNVLVSVQLDGRGISGEIVLASKYILSQTAVARVTWKNEQDYWQNKVSQPMRAENPDIGEIEWALTALLTEAGLVDIAADAIRQTCQMYLTALDTAYTLDSAIWKGVKIYAVNDRHAGWVVAIVRRKQGVEGETSVSIDFNKNVVSIYSRKEAPLLVRAAFEAIQRMSAPTDIPSLDGTVQKIVSAILRTHND